MSYQDRFVFLIGGPSGVGKTTTAAEIGRRLAIPWLQVDDLRLAFQHSKVTLPENSDDLYFFADIEDRAYVWQSDPSLLRDKLIAIGELLCPAIEVVIEHHLSQNQPIIIEGDGILPLLLDRPALAPSVSDGLIRTVFIAETNLEQLLGNMLERNRGIDNISQEHLQTEAHAKFLFGEYVAVEAHKRGLSVVESRPFENLAERVLHSLS